MVDEGEGQPCRKSAHQVRHELAQKRQRTRYELKLSVGLSAPLDAPLLANCAKSGDLFRGSRHHGMSMRNPASPFLASSRSPFINTSTSLIRLGHVVFDCSQSHQSILHSYQCPRLFSFRPHLQRRRETVRAPVEVNPSTPLRSA